MKESRAQRLETILRMNGGRATLGRILSEIREDGGLVYKFTAACSEARQAMALRTPPETIVCYKGATAGENVYQIERVHDDLFGRRAA